MREERQHERLVYSPSFNEGLHPTLPQVWFLLHQLLGSLSLTQQVRGLQRKAALTTPSQSLERLSDDPQEIPPVGVVVEEQPFTSTC
jgi:hypothetical protein